MQKQTIFTNDEFNLICSYDRSSMFELIEELEKSLRVVVDEEMINLLESVIFKLVDMRQEDFDKIEFAYEYV